jgi:3-methyl-2-oxobutanoate hydroxymethyltransferase
MKTVNLHTLQRYKAEGEKIACLTSYDATFTQILNEANVDIIHVGDSLAQAIHGLKTPIPVTTDDICYHLTTVARANTRAFLMADMPFLTYATETDAIYNAKKLMQHGAQMLKLEGGQDIAAIVSALTRIGVPVCGHIGLMAQSVHAQGGYRIQGRSNEQAERLLDDAHTLETAGAKLLVLECIPQALAKIITASVSIPTIGIGAGRDCDGQILVVYDMIGITPGKPFTFVKNFLDEQHPSIQAAVQAYVTAVKNSTFPSTEHGFD